jgi:hypothetical protein
MDPGRAPLPPQSGVPPGVVGMLSIPEALAVAEPDRPVEPRDGGIPEAWCRPLRRPGPSPLLAGAPSFLR